MAERFLELSAENRRDILNTVATRPNAFSAKVFEKDLWVCWVLEQLFAFPGKQALAFKGGTSLSKVFHLIQRFSEDIDVTIDYRSFLKHEDPFDQVHSRSKIKKISDDLVLQTEAYVRDEIRPYLQKALREFLGNGEARYAGSAVIEVTYASALQMAGDPYMADKVKVEFGGRNTADPNEKHTVTPYLKDFIPSLEFPEATVRVLSPERTFWEKVTLIHAENQRKEFRASKDRLARHWYDLALMARSKMGPKAIARRDLLEDVVRFKSTFFYTASANYEACLRGGIQILPSKENLPALKEDYRKMREAGMFYGDPPTFNKMIEILGQLEADLAQ